MADGVFADADFQTAGSGVALSQTGSASVSAPAPLDDGLFVDSPAAPAAASPVGNGAAPINLDEYAPDAPLSTQSTEDAFFVHYTPPPPAAEEPKPVEVEHVDPRVEWRKQNREVLSKKDAEEAAAKAAVLAKAKEHLARFYEVRNTTLSQRKSTNRKNETVLPGEVPTTGTTWEKVHALVNFSSTTGHTRDVGRYKSVLITCKANNVAVKA